MMQSSNRRSFGRGRAVLGLTTAALILGACATRPPPESQEIALPESYQLAELAPADVAFPEPDWWQRFDSPVLDDLVTRAIDNNPDLSAAAARIARADAELRRNRAGLLPQVNADGSASRNSRPFVDPPQDRGGSSYSLGLRASYELDLWGAESASVEAAQARALASRYDQEAVALSLVSEVALGYIALLGLERQIEATRRSLDLAREVEALTAVRERAGASSGLESAQQRSVIAGLEARATDLERQVRARRAALAVLLGEAPGAEFGNGEAMLDLAVPLPSPGLPAELLRRRPDLRAAEAELAGAAADVAVARAALFPSLSLTAGGSSASDALRSLLDPAGLVLTVSASLAQSVFDGGARRAGIESSEAQQVALLEGYRGSVLSALQEVETALSDAQAQARIESARLEALDAARQALAIAEAQFRTGAVDFLNLLEAQRSLIDAETQAILARQARLEAAIGLYRALGGGYDPEAPGLRLAQTE
ncbi:efflux transporter outer membrane subunit [Aquibaculum arenosum]|uniref:Efflux transporter outer membrane subunit n=1 Tax=Aquibaculum arenosum TaxID=3032591 RepID=A0ABT5YJS5_9PROT|nr:efflux transporter outer membrane subunit [Fodinicurvata sp. CAU 1616]MDF2095195.1 efflux transporter outer membrane subunit [Fodinicurvata sp. CAU 1616]